MIDTESVSEGFALATNTRSEAARKLGATPRQVARWSQQGRLGSVRLGNRTLHTDEQLAAFVRACTRGPVAS